MFSKIHWISQHEPGDVQNVRYSILASIELQIQFKVFDFWSSLWAKSKTFKIEKTFVILKGEYCTWHSWPLSGQQSFWNSSYFANHIQRKPLQGRFDEILNRFFFRVKTKKNCLKKLPRCPSDPASLPRCKSPAWAGAVKNRPDCTRPTGKACDKSLWDAGGRTSPCALFCLLDPMRASISASCFCCSSSSCLRWEACILFSSCAIASAGSCGAAVCKFGCCWNSAAGSFCRGVCAAGSFCRGVCATGSGGGGACATGSCSGGAWAAGPCSGGCLGRWVLLRRCGCSWHSWRLVLRRWVLEVLFLQQRCLCWHLLRRVLHWVLVHRFLQWWCKVLLHRCHLLPVLLV